MRSLSEVRCRRWTAVSLHAPLLLEIHAERLEHLHCCGAPGTEHPAARMLKRSHQIEALEAGYGVLPKFRRGTMRAALISGIGDAVQVTVPEAWAAALHVHRTVDMGFKNTAWNVGDELRQMGEHVVRIFLFGFVPAAPIRAPVGHIVPQM